jgi:hypothetical protein
MFNKLKSRMFAERHTDDEKCSVLRFQCPAGSDWHIRLPRLGRTEIAVTNGDLLISADGNTTRMNTEQRFTLSIAEQFFLYNTSETEAEITLSPAPAAKITFRKIPTG